MCVCVLGVWGFVWWEMVECLCEMFVIDWLEYVECVYLECV